MMRSAAILISTFCLTLFLYSCGSQSRSSDTIQKDELILAIGGLPMDGFDPTHGWGLLGTPLFQSKLFRFDEKLHLQSELAIGYQISDDGLKWTVKLRDDVKFSDGKPFSAEDVIFTFETAKKSKSFIDLTFLEKTDAIDSKTVQFTLKKPHSAFIYLMEGLGIVPKHAYTVSYSENPIGTGPYKLVKWDKEQQIIVEPNPFYFGKKPYFKKITFLSLSEDAAFSAAKAGKVDMIAVSPSLANQDVKGMRLQEVKSVDYRGISMPVLPDEGKLHNDHHIGNNVTSQIAIRKALNIGIDRQKIVDEVLNGYGSPAYSMADHLPWSNPDALFKDANLELAKSILEEAGWKETRDGIREKDGTKAEFTVFYPRTNQSDLEQGLALAFAKMAMPMGIRVQVKSVSFDALGRTFDQPVLYGGGSLNPLDFYKAYSSNTIADNTNHNNFYSSNTVDDYFRKALAALTIEDANSYWGKAQWDGKTGFSFKGDAVWVPLVTFKHLYLINENLEIGSGRKLEPHPHSWPVADNIESWYWKD